jgi:hypothetical protein
VKVSKEKRRRSARRMANFENLVKKVSKRLATLFLLLLVFGLGRLGDFGVGSGFDSL